MSHPVSTESGRPETRSRPGGPRLAVLGGVFAVLTVAYVVLSAATPRPTESAQAVLDFYLSHAGVLRLAGFLQFAAAFPLVIFAAIAYRRLRQLGVTAPGTAIGFAGGLLASISLVLSGLVTWTASQVAGVIDTGLAKTLSEFGFGLGGPAYVVSFGLLMAGIAASSLILGLLPKPVAWAGLIIAGLAVLGALALLTPVFGPALPIGRFGGLIWLVTAGVMLSGTGRRWPAGPST